MTFPTFSTLQPARLRARHVVARDQISLVLAVSDEVAAAHRHAGQFAKVRVPGVDAEGIYAMWNAPFERDEVPSLRFLLRTANVEGGEVASALAERPIGSDVEVSLPVGEGFGGELARRRTVRFVATGTALAPVRAGLEAWLVARADGARASLDVGVRSLEYLPFGEDLARYREAGVDVHVHCSAPSASGEVIGVRAHDAVLAREPDVRDVLFVAVGQPAMVRELREQVVRRGGRGDDVVSNY